MTGGHPPVSERLSAAWLQFESARAYTRTLLEGLTPDQWYWTPQPAVTHIAWQIGHLAMAEYGLWLFRQRGRSEIDTELMSGKFRKLFMKGTKPSAQRGDYPEPAEILEVWERVHQQVEREFPSFDGPQLDEPLDPPYAAYGTRLGTLLFASHHEMLHAGQIGLLRRLMGQVPVR